MRCSLCYTILYTCFVMCSCRYVSRVCGSEGGSSRQRGGKTSRWVMGSDRRPFQRGHRGGRGRGGAGGVAGGAGQEGRQPQARPERSGRGGRGQRRGRNTRRGKVGTVIYSCMCCMCNVYRSAFSVLLP